MTKAEVIALAEKCKLAVLIHSQWTAEIKEFTVVDYVVEGDLGSLMQFADLVAFAEREACAQIAEEESMRGLPDEKPKGVYLKMAVAQIACGTLIADAIRERGQA